MCTYVGNDDGKGARCCARRDELPRTTVPFCMRVDACFTVTHERKCRIIQNVQFSVRERRFGRQEGYQSVVGVAAGTVIIPGLSLSTVLLWSFCFSLYDSFVARACGCAVSSSFPRW